MIDDDFINLINEIDRQKKNLDGRPIEFSDKGYYDKLKKNLTDTLENCLEFGDFAANIILSNLDYFKRVQDSIKKSPGKTGIPFNWNKFNGKIHFHPHPRYHGNLNGKEKISFKYHDIVFEIIYEIEKPEENSEKPSLKILSWNLGSLEKQSWFRSNKYSFNDFDIKTFIDKMNNYKPNYRSSANSMFWNLMEQSAISITELFVPFKKAFMKILERLLSDILYTLDKNSSTLEHQTEKSSESNEIALMAWLKNG